jgi:hypothetical protein
MARKTKFDLEALDRAASGASAIMRENTAEADKARGKPKKKKLVQLLLDNDELALVEAAKKAANISGTSTFCRKYVLDAAKALLKDA